MKAVDVGQAPARLRAVEDLLTLAWLHAAERDARTWLALGANQGFRGAALQGRDAADPSACTPMIRGICSNQPSCCRSLKPL